MFFWSSPLSFLQRIQDSLLTSISLIFIIILKGREGENIVPLNRIKPGLPFRDLVKFFICMVPKSYL
jgi:hypothetical protein